MSEFMPGVGPIRYEPSMQIQQTPIADPTVPEKPDEALTPEQIRAIEAALVQDKESATVAGLLGMWTGSMLLKDLAQEHFSLPADEERSRTRKDKSDLPQLPVEEK